MTIDDIHQLYDDYASQGYTGTCIVVSYETWNAFKLVGTLPQFLCALPTLGQSQAMVTYFDGNKLLSQIRYLYDDDIDMEYINVEIFDD
jgi:hypothetical protein